MKNKGVDRRQALGSLGLAAVGASTLGESLAEAAKPAGQWDVETDILCVGSGAAACTAAVTALAGGARVMVAEKMPVLGGTTSKSGGIIWIPNNFALRAAGLVDGREDCLRYMARYSYPQRYDPGSPTLGLLDRDYRLLEAFYDNGSAAIDQLRSVKAMDFNMFRLFGVNRDAPDYADHLPENKLPSGRCLEPAVGAGHHGGAAIASQLEAYLRSRKVPILTGTAVTAVVRENGRIVGAIAESEGKTLRIRARKGVIFGTGGYSHDEELVDLHQEALYGACAMTGATGDFIRIASSAGARMGSMGTAWRAQVVLDEALENRAVGFTILLVPGDSMIFVNKYGRRVVNEKRNYNDRTRVHFQYDPTREEYPNQLLFMLFDRRSVDAFGGDFPFPRDVREQPYIIQGESWDALFANIDQRLKTLAAQTGGVALAPDFAATTRKTLADFDGYARSGKDLEFARGEHRYDREYHPFFSPMREGTEYPKNPMPNVTMHPMADTGPYYAFVVAAGALDTSGGPMIDARARVLDADSKPIPGLFGAGNCIAAPTRGAYYGAGGTIGPAMAFGYIAARTALAESAA
ncbi:FAD-dependent oxidoreductase [Sphingomonas sp. SRS2]|uniref:FAD-dependent oxidoreductase n=1 Tax=Sphingomonas sp. SRS2 TaxID=133190 RepID=UPI00061848EB|nr:FAD-dependent oxidoreductase [Sphingomonas sp. SRS2]KKC26033.1 3-ketosteroid dehydrogenase [Sphingomonas sp. SRS2]